MSVATLLVSMEPRREMSRLNCPRAKRNLFNLTADPADLARRYEQLSREQMERFKETWGWDAEHDRPVENHPRYEWTASGASATASKPPASPPAQREHRDSSPDEQTSSVAVTVTQDNSTKPTRQMNIDEMFRGKKRSSGGSTTAALIKKQRLSSSEDSSSASPPLDEAATSSSQPVN